MLQEMILVYFDFFVKDLHLAEQLHIVFFDVPFNILVALLFWKFYQVGKKRYAALISSGWFLYAVFVPIFFYTEGNILLYTISLSHMVIMFAGFVLLYESPTGQSILEILPAVEKRLSTAMKYQLKPGKTYLLENIDKAYDIFMDAALHGIRGMILSRTKPDMIQQKYELAVTPVLWLTHVQSALPTADPSELEQLGFLMEKFMTAAKEQALTEGEAPEKQQITSSQPPPQSPDHKPIIDFKPQTSDQKLSPIQPQQPAPAAEKKPEEEWKQKMKETLAEVAGKKPIVLGEELTQKPLQEAVKDVEKAGVAVAVKKGKIMVFGEETKEEATETKSSPPISPSPTIIPQPLESQHKTISSQPPVPSTKPHTPDHKPQIMIPSQPFPLPQSPDRPPLTPDPLLQTSDHRPKTTGSRPFSPDHQPTTTDQRPPTLDLSEKPLKELVQEAQKTGESLEIKGKPGEQAQVEIKRGKMLILGDDKKDAKTKASFILAMGDIASGGGLNKSIILLDGLEYLMTNNTFALVLHLLQMLKDKISLGESMLLLPIDPKCIDEKEMALLQQEFETYVEENE